MKNLRTEMQEIIQIVDNVKLEIENLQFPTMDISISKEFSKLWEDKFLRVLSSVENYKNNEFPVVIVGRLNAGKSTLLNALLGMEILPCANRDTTSLMTKIHYGNIDAARIYYVDGSSQQIEFEQKEIEKYVNYRGEHFCEKIKHIDITMNNSLLTDGICFFDSPGLDSVNELNEVISYDLLIRANSVILVFSGQDGGGQEYFELIKKIFSLNYDKNYNIIFVITKADLMDEVEYKQAHDCLLELIEKAQRDLGEKNNVSYNICGVSAYCALKYQQIKKGIISEDNAVRDSKLKLKTIDDLEKIYDESNFSKLYELLQLSVIKSNGKRRKALNLFVLINNFLSNLIEAYLFIDKSMNESTELEERKNKCVEQKRLIKTIGEEGNKVLNKCESQLKVFNTETYAKKKANEILEASFSRIVSYIDNTPYETLKKNKMENLNREANSIIKEQAWLEMNLLEKQFREILQNTISELENIEKNYSSELAKTFNLSIMEENHFTYNGIQIKSRFLMKGLIGMLASNAVLGMGSTYVMGDAIYPGSGGIIAAAIGAIANIVMIINCYSEKNKKEEIRKDIYAKLMEDEECLGLVSVIKNLSNEYLSYTMKLYESLITELNDNMKYYKQIVRDYDEYQKEREAIRKNISRDINSIKNIFPLIGSMINEYTEE